ncbi:SCO family protein [Sphingopyxis sp.]|uniref:SCO family protein n=1 Tax=Sphingopyxis sp. TaxID=1908224 RepID=UPI001D8B7245|nr:SCO family protein [Sphingopyxis sp.]MBW8294502.1 SCO family protein [Sphingopyxis sp.]
MTEIDPAATTSLKNLRVLLWIVAGLAAVIGLLLYAGSAQKNIPASDYASAFGGPFELTAADGSKVTDKTLAGKPYAIFFGFTRCPDVCPTSLARMARLRQQLGDEGMKFNIVFVSVDPEQDKPSDIGSYVELFGTPIIGLTGDDTQLAQIKKGYGVYAKQVPINPAQPQGDYTIDHTAAIYLIGAKGEFVSTIDYHEADSVALDKLRRLIA